MNHVWEKFKVPNRCVAPEPFPGKTTLGTTKVLSLFFKAGSTQHQNFRAQGHPKRHLAGREGPQQSGQKDQDKSQDAKRRKQHLSRSLSSDWCPSSPPLSRRSDK